MNDGLHDVMDSHASVEREEPHGDEPRSPANENTISQKKDNHDRNSYERNRDIVGIL